MHSLCMVGAPCLFLRKVLVKRMNIQEKHENTTVSI